MYATYHENRKKKQVEVQGRNQVEDLAIDPQGLRKSDVVPGCPRNYHHNEAWSNGLKIVGTSTEGHFYLGRVPSCRAGRIRLCARRPASKAPSTKAGSGSGTRPVQLERIPDERTEVLSIRVVRVDGPDPTLTAPPDVEEPEFSVLVCLCDLDS